MTTYVLIPGACHGAWCFDDLADALCSRGHRVHAHDRVAIDAMNPPISAEAGEQVTERAVAAQRRCGRHYRDGAVAEVRARKVHDVADAAHGRRAVEGRADLVVHQRHGQPGHRCKHGLELLVHLCGRHRPACARHADRTEGSQFAERLLVGHFQEQRAFEPGEGQHLQRIAGAGEIVTVEGEPQHARLYSWPK